MALEVDHLATLAREMICRSSTTLGAFSLTSSPDPEALGKKIQYLRCGDKCGFQNRPVYIQLSRVRVRFFAHAWAPAMAAPLVSSRETRKTSPTIRKRIIASRHSACTADLPARRSLVDRLFIIKRLSSLLGFSARQSHRGP
jgi:hypothetical protein